jgi:hypothetical protein
MENHRKLSIHNYTTNRLTQLFVSADVFPRQNDFLAFRVIIHILNSNMPPALNSLPISQIIVYYMSDTLNHKTNPLG